MRTEHVSGDGSQVADHDHVHDHPEPHVHAHAHGHASNLDPAHDEGPLGTSDPGSVVLDIGGDAGALVVRTTFHLHGREIEIRAVGEPWAGAHTAVRQRQASHVQFAGVFPRLDAGLYELRVLGSDDDGLTVLVEPGIVNELWMGARRD